MPRSCILLAIAVLCGALDESGFAAAEGFVRALPPSVPVAERPITYDSPGQPFGLPLADQDAALYQQPVPSGLWTWQLLPEGLMYKSYLAGGREPRFATHWMWEQDGDSLWDIALGGRVGMLRYGTQDAFWPEGWQVDVEGAAFPRLTLDYYRDLVSVDFRFGIPLTFRRSPWETKLAYYHLSSHLGDEYLAAHPGAVRINYTRDVLVWGVALRPQEDFRLYAEAGWAFYISGGAEPWEFQFGAEYSPARPTDFSGAPFFAINTRLRQEVDFGGNFAVQTGWQWRGHSGQLIRLGFHYLNGKSDQFQFHTQYEEQFAIAVWYDY